METIAVYWEEKVQVYGISTKAGLCLGKLHFPEQLNEIWGDRITDLTEKSEKFEFVTLHNLKNNIFELLFVFEIKKKPGVVNYFQTVLEHDNKASFQTEDPVDIIYLHGPHFQDRFGIAEQALSALETYDKFITASGCAGTSMYIISRGGYGQKIVSILTDTFLIPVSK